MTAEKSARDIYNSLNLKLITLVEEQLKFIKSELARTEETTRVLEGMLVRPASSCSCCLQSREFSM